MSADVKTNSSGSTVKKPLSPEEKAKITLQSIFNLLSDQLQGYEVRDPQLELAGSIERAF